MKDFLIFCDDLMLPTDPGDAVSKSSTNGSSHLDLFDLPLFNRLRESLPVSEDDSQSGGLVSLIENYAKECDDSDKQLQMTAVGIGVLKLFIQKNWIGPNVPLDDRVLQLTKFDSRDNVLKHLVVDGENVISIVEVPELLLLSKQILESSWSHFSNLQTAKIWYLRCLFIHQQILEELSPELFDKIGILIGEIEKALTEMPRNVVISFHLEFARIYMYYQHVQKSKVEVKAATEASGIEISLSGALGKRTKFQVQDLAQLILKVDLENEENFNEPTSCCVQPKDVKLDDDVRLDKIKYVDKDDNKYPDLSGLQQAVVLGNLFQTQKSQPKDSLADEELQPLIDCILEQPKIWSIRMTTLLLRSKLEASHKRTVERAMMQVDVLSDCLKEPEISLKERFTYFFISHMPPKWDFLSTLADILVSMGSIKTSLEIYKNLEDWENVIYCYNALNLRHKAQEIIEQELKKSPNPKLWCLLGDATDDVSCYEKAWELSGRRSAKAQRHWAYFYYYRKNYLESIEHFEKSLEINSLQKDLWYRLGYAALVEEKWEISAKAYRRYCVLDPECFEAWNNLARCYCELKQKPRAWRALQEALKVDYSSWKVWDNYMLVSSDLKAFDEVIRSYHEILNLKKKHLDIPVLNCLVARCRLLKEEGENETENAESNKLRSRLLELFGRLTSQGPLLRTAKGKLSGKTWLQLPKLFSVACMNNIAPPEVLNDPELWFLHSEIVDTDTPENINKKYQLLMKSHSSATNKPDWVNSLENCNRVVYVLSKMVEVGLQTQDPRIHRSCRLAARGVVARIKKLYPDAGVCEKLEKNLEELDKVLDD